MWVSPPNKKKLVNPGPGVFIIEGWPIFLVFYIGIFNLILEGSFEIQFLAIF